MPSHPQPVVDVAVVGAGAFGAWIALTLRRRGASVLLIESHRPGHARASSGGETRIIRAGYGEDEVYTRWAVQSLPEWRDLAVTTGERLVADTGLLWLGRDGDPLMTATLATFARLGIDYERLNRSQIEARFPQVATGAISWGILERGAAVLMARRAVQAAVRQAVAEGVAYRTGRARAPSTGAPRAGAIALGGGGVVAAGAFVFALGPWLRTAFPDLLADRMFVTRQEVYYLGTPPGDPRFAPRLLPAWIDFAAGVYGIPDLEGRGFKIAVDRHGPELDPDAGERAITPETLAVARAYVAERFPALRDAPLVGAEVCQYENTSDGHFLIDRHPAFADVWLVGGGSGHGFKHGPAVGASVAACVLEGRKPDARFRLASKGTIQRRTVF
jgi:monomeric sarcosine oxidase